MVRENSPREVSAQHWTDIWGQIISPALARSESLARVLGLRGVQSAVLSAA